MSNFSGNTLLAALSPDELKRLRNELEPVPLARRATLIEHGARIRHVFFPTSGVISLVHLLADGSSAEVGVIGSEGCVGLGAFLGATKAAEKAVVQVSGQAFRVKAAALEREFRRGGRFHTAVLRYAHSLVGQLAQIAACNRHHSVDQQLCRWLLTTRDRSHSDELLTTQEWIASLLGVRREGVTEAARRLQELGLIRYSRGRITVLSRAKLEARACECYAALRNRIGVL